MLEIRNLSHRYASGVQALDNLSLDIPTGMFGLLGPNGAGKSTFMRILATLQQPTSGSIRFGEINLLAEPERLRQVLGYLPQEFGVYPRISAEALLDHLAILKGVGNKGERRDLVAGLLEQTNLYSARKNAVASFSGGMRQRFGIAQALIGQPRLIIVDEPTAGLDPEERNRFHNLLCEIGEQVVVILSTHIVEDVADLCPRMAIIVAGHIVAQGEPQRLVETIQGRIWQKTVDKSEIEALRAAHAVMSTRLYAGRSVVHILADGDPGEGFAPRVATLEDVYFATLFTERHRHEGRKAA